MTNPIPSLTLITMMTNPPVTNWLTPSGKDIEVGRSICTECVTQFTLNGVPTKVTNCFTNSLLLERFALREEWVPGPIPNIQSVEKTNPQPNLNARSTLPVPTIVCYTNYDAVNQEWAPAPMPNIKRPTPLTPHR